MELKKKLALRWQGKQNIIVISLPVDALAQAGHAYGLGPQLGTQRLGSTMGRRASSETDFRGTFKNRAAGATSQTLLGNRGRLKMA